MTLFALLAASMPWALAVILIACVVGLIHSVRSDLTRRIR